MEDQTEALSLESQLGTFATRFVENVTMWLQSPEFYLQLGVALSTFVAAWVLTRFARRFMREDLPGTVLSRMRPLVLPALTALLLGGAANYLDGGAALGDPDGSTGGQARPWVILIIQGLAVIWLIYRAAREWLRGGAERAYVNWIVVPVSLLYVFGLLPPVIDYLDGVKLAVGNISISLYALARVAVFGSLLFWLGRLSNLSGQNYIRRQESLEVGTREVVAKLFEIGIWVLTFMLVLNVMGLNLTAFAVFGGAVGVGLGFGLQAIASNFISGLILLLDRSLTVGDYVELEDGRGGTIRALNMRSTILETYDGKDIVVPNETFVTSSFQNWTHYDNKQRYDITFQVAYDSDIDTLVPLLRDLVASHPQVLSGADASEEEQPDAEIDGFGESGIDILVEYWMVGIDDGRNRVGADLNLMIWRALKEHGFQMPFPQREVRMLS